MYSAIIFNIFILPNFQYFVLISNKANTRQIKIAIDPVWNTHVQLGKLRKLGKFLEII